MGFLLAVDLEMRKKQKSSESKIVVLCLQMGETLLFSDYCPTLFLSFVLVFFLEGMATLYLEVQTPRLLAGKQLAPF